MLFRNFWWVIFSFWLVACQAAETETVVENGAAKEMQERSVEQQLSEQSRLLEEIKSELTGIRQELKNSRTEMARLRLSDRGEDNDSVKRVSIDDDYFKGRSTAALTLIEFSDFQCPFCARFYKETLPQIEREYVQTGKLKYVFRDFPIDSIHKEAFKAAEAANCAGEQDNFWPMHDVLFENQKNLKPRDLERYAEQLKLDLNKFNSCLNSGKYVNEINKDRLDGQRAGVQGTPGFFLGRTTDDGTIEGFPIKGARSFSYFKQIIEAMLQEG